MRRPGFAEINTGAMAGLVVGAIGGLFSVGIAPAIISRNPQVLASTPVLSMICFVLSGIVGWIIGGQVGPRVGDWFRNERAELLGGAMGGLVPVIGIALWGWWMVSS